MEIKSEIKKSSGGVTEEIVRRRNRSNRRNGVTEEME